MKFYLILGAFFVLAFILVSSFFWFYSTPPRTSAVLSLSPAPAVAPSLPSGSINTSGIVKPKHRLIFHIPFTPEEAALMQWRAEQMAKDPSYDWKQPINFCGLVVDEHNLPLPGANVKWITTNNTGNGEGTTSSGTDGRFFIGTTGKGIDVVVKKDGYRTVEQGVSFEFADFTQYNYYDHDKDNPVLFHLRKIPPYEPIYIWFGGVQDNLIGNKTTIDPVTKHIIQGESSQGMWIQFVPGPLNSPDRGQYDIVLGTASGGGVFLVTGDSDENAPESGYKTPWDTHITVDYIGNRYINFKAFFKDGTGHYGSMSFDIDLSANKLSIGYLLKYNPRGGTSLSAQTHTPFQINKTPY